MLYREFVLRDSDVWRLLVTFVKANAKACCEAGKPLRVIVTQDEKKRNELQNARYWKAIVTPIAQHAWVGGRQFDKKVWHEMLADTFGVMIEIPLPNGKVVVRRKSTTEMGVGEFSEYMQKCEAYAATELGIEFDG